MTGVRDGRSRRRPAPARRWTRSRALLALIALAGAVLNLVASFQVWLRLPDGAGGVSTASGWGAVAGGAQIAGQNLNDALAGQATFRPGLIPLLFGGLTLPAVLALALVGGGIRPHRITGAVLAGCGLITLSWGIWRAVAPDSVGLLAAGEGGPGVGQWLSIAGGALLVTSAVALLVGVLDPSPVPVARGIQPG